MTQHFVWRGWAVAAGAAVCSSPSAGRWSPCVGTTGTPTAASAPPLPTAWPWTTRDTARPWACSPTVAPTPSAPLSAAPSSLPLPANPSWRQVGRSLQTGGSCPALQGDAWNKTGFNMLYEWMESIKRWLCLGLEPGSIRTQISKPALERPWL